MGVRKTTKIFLIAAIGLTALVVDQLYFNPNVRVLRSLSSEEKPSVENRVKSYNSPGSIAAVIGTAKMASGGLYTTFLTSWVCDHLPKKTTVRSCITKDNRLTIKTHAFQWGAERIEKHRKENPDGQCLVVTGIRSPATWFASMYLQMAKQNWRPKEEMVQSYREFLATDDFHMLLMALPGLLKEFNAGTLVEQMKEMDKNGGYSLTTAPSTSMLAGCDLLILRMEQSDQWPGFFQMLDNGFHSVKGRSRVQQYRNNLDQINAITSYELTSEEKINIYTGRNEFIHDWFDAYGYMDDVDVTSISNMTRTS